MSWRYLLALAAAAAGLGFAGAQAAPSGEITVWGWNTAYTALVHALPGFNAKYPDVKVDVQKMASQDPDIYNKVLASCSAGGTDLPDVVGIQNYQGDTIWSRFPDCFTDLTTLGYTPAMQAMFPDFKRAELESNGKAFAVPWDSGPVMMFYRRDFYKKAGVDPASIKTWDDFIAAGKKIMAANPGVVMAQADLAGDTEWLRMMAQGEKCGFFDVKTGAITVNQPTCVAALDKMKAMKDAGLLTAANWGEKLQAIKGNAVATAMYGGWYAGVIESNDPEQKGLWGVYRMPSIGATGTHAANFGGSALAIPASSKNKEAAFAFVQYALGTVEGQSIQLKDDGMIPSLLAALNDPVVGQPSDYWGGQKIYAEMLATLPDIAPDRATPFLGDANPIVNAAQTKYLNGGYPTAQAAMDDAAKQIAAASGQPIK